MRLLEKYILKDSILIFLGCLGIFIFLYIIVDLFSHLDEILKQKIPLLQLCIYYYTFLPTIFLQVSPIACLLAVLYNLGRMNQFNEIIAMRCSGLSIWQITKHLIVFGLLVCIVSFLISERILPSAQSLNTKIKLNMYKKLTSQELLKNLAIYGLENRLFYIGKFYVKENILENITVFQQDKNQNILSKLVAQKGIWNGKYWLFQNVLIYNFEKNGTLKGEPVYLKEKIINFSEDPLYFIQQNQEISFMNAHQLYSYIQRLSQSGAKTAIRNLKVDFYRRIAFPFTNVTMVLLGIAFSLRIKGRKTFLSSLGICLVIGFLYYMSGALFIAFGKIGILPAGISAGLAHIVFLGIGVFYLKNLP